MIALLPYDFYDAENDNKLYTSVMDTGAPQTTLPYYIKGTIGRRQLWPFGLIDNWTIGLSDYWTLPNPIPNFIGLLDLYLMLINKSYNVY